MASIRTLTSIPENYKQLVWKFISTLPKNINRIDIIADTYEDISLKTYERRKRCVSRPIKVQSSKSRIPLPFSNFLKNDENKKRLIE